MARPAIVELDIDAAEEYARELRGRGVDAHAYACDVSDRSAVESTAAAVAAETSDRATCS